MSSDSLSAGKVSMKVEGDAKGFGSNVARDIEAEEGLFSRIGHKIGETVVAGFAAIGLGAGIVETIKTGFEAYSNWEAMNAQFAAGIKSTGNAAGLSVEEMDKLAESVSNYSGQTVDSIGKTEQVLQTFEGIKNVGPDKIFDQATEAAANMAAKLGGDASGSAIQLGKALQDPVKGMTALRRVGVAFSDAQQKAIKADVARGDSLSAQKVILKELSVEFGGAAKAAGETFPGEVARARNSLEELSRVAVTAIGPILTPIIAAFADKVGSLQTKVEGVAGAIQTTLVPKIENIGKVIGLAFKLLQGQDEIKFKAIDLGPWTKPLLLLGSIIRQIGGAFGEFFKSIGDAFKSSGGATNTALANLVLNFLKLVQSLSPLSIILKAVGPQLPSLALSLAQMLQSVTPLATQFAKFAAQVVAWLVPILRSPGVIKAIIGALILWKGAMVGAGIAKHAAEVGGLVKDYGKIAGSILKNIGLIAKQTAGIIASGARWVASVGETIAIEALYVKDAVVNAAKTAAAWVAAKVKILAGWAAQAAAATLNAAKSAAVWTVQAGKSVAAWVLAKSTIIAGFVAQAAAAVVNGAKMAAVWLAQKAAVLAQIAVMGLLKGAQIAATAAQWLFNAAMDANPIGIIIVAIAALVAGLIWFFTQTKLGKAIWQDIVNFLVAAWQFLVATAQTVWNVIVAAVVTAINAVKAVIQTVITWVTTFWNLELAAWRLVITTVFNAIKAVVTTVIDTVKAIINRVVGWISAFIKVEVYLWRTIFTTVFNAVHAVVTTVIDTVRGVISGAISFITGAWSRGWNLVLSVVKTVVGNVLTAVTTTISKVTSFFGTVGSKIIGAIGNAGAMLLGIGKNIVDGLVNGIKGAWGAVTDAIGQLAHLIPEPIRKILGIRSPSVVFKQIGDFLGKGLVQGINGTKASVSTAMGDLATKIKDTFNSLVDKRTAAQKALARLDTELGDTSALTAAGRKRRASLESQIADQRKVVAELTRESSAKTESTILKLIKADNTKLTAEAAKRDAIGAKLTAAQNSLKAALTTETDYAGSVASNAQGTGNVVDSNSKSSGDIIAKLQAAVANTRLLQSDLTKLKSLGIDDVTLKQIADAGVANGGLDAANELLAGGKDAVSQVASLQKQLTAASDSLGTSTSKDLYQAGVNAAQGLVDGLNKQEKALTAAMDKLGDSLVKSIKHKLDIHSPSRVMDELGGFVGLGFAQGITKSTPKVTKATTDLFSIPSTVGQIKSQARVLATLPVPGGSGVAPIVNNFNGQMGYTKDEVADSIVTRQRRAQQKVKVPRTVV